MKSFEQLSYTEKIKWRIRILRLLTVVMLIYMIVIGEMGGGDSRIMSDLSNIASDIIFFGGLIYIVYRIIANKKLLKNRLLLKEQLREELDERNQYLHDKSGGVVWDILLIVLLGITVTAALFNMAAFYTSFTILGIAIVLKVSAYWIYSRK